MRPIVLSGFMGTGKTTVGRRLAARLERKFVDLDETIEKATGKSIDAIFRAEGETAFRKMEREHLRRVLAEAGDVVLSLGGGTVLGTALRHELVDRSSIVTLTADVSTIQKRIGGGGRPLLEGADEGRVRELLALRSHAYAECHFSVATDDREPDDVAEIIASLLPRDPVLVPLGERSYLVDFTTGDGAVLTDRIASLAPSRIVYVSDSNVERATGKEIARSIDALAIESTEIILPHGEKQKNITNVQAIWDVALGFGVDRESLIVAAGGGVVGDLAGFAAATLLRGIRFLYAPTTLLAMVDASVGGKTAIHHTTGKNQVGAFHQPSAVVVDFARLTTLSPRETVAGLSELVKVALVSDVALFEAIEASAEKIAIRDVATLAPLVRRAIELKARAVREDERDVGDRQLLNYGHTVGHALEAYGDFRRHRHGEAVAIGILRELTLGVSLGVTPEATLVRTEKLLGRLGLPVAVRSEELAAAWHYARADKKRAGDRIRMPLVTEIGASRVESMTMDRVHPAFLAK